jgi:hypothetical protein
MASLTALVWWRGCPLPPNPSTPQWCPVLTTLSCSNWNTLAWTDMQTGSFAMIFFGNGFSYKCGSWVAAQDRWWISLFILLEIVMCTIDGANICMLAGRISKWHAYKGVNNCLFVFRWPRIDMKQIWEKYIFYTLIC